MKLALGLVLFAGLSVTHDTPTVASVPPEARISSSAASQPVVAGFDANSYLNDCAALVADWRQLQQLELELGR